MNEELKRGDEMDPSCDSWDLIFQCHAPQPPRHMASSKEHSFQAISESLRGKLEVSPEVSLAGDDILI